MQMIRVGDLCHPSRGNLKLDRDELIDYVDISSVDNKTKKIIGFVTYSFEEAPSRARKEVRQNDIIVSTVRPNLNAVAIFDSDTPNTPVVSTGFSVLSPLEDVDPRFLFQFCQSDSFINCLTEQATGASYPAVNDKIVRDVHVPDYTLSEQRKISLRLDSIQDLIDIKLDENLKFEQVIKAKFANMFGDPVHNPMGWTVKRLGELSTQINSGNTPKGGEQVYVEKGITFFRSQNVWKDRLEMEDIAYIDEETHAHMKRSSLKYGDILMTKTGRINTENSSLGRAALYLGEDDAANVNGHVYFIRLKSDVNRKFVLRILVSDEYRDYIRSVCVGGIDKRQLNKDHIEGFPIICPPDDMIDKYTEFVDYTEKAKSENTMIIEKLKSAKAALMQEYFG